MQYVCLFLSADGGCPGPNLVRAYFACGRLVCISRGSHPLAGSAHGLKKRRRALLEAVMLLGQRSEQLQPTLIPSRRDAQGHLVCLSEMDTACFLL